MTTTSTTTQTLKDLAGDPLCNGKMVSVGSGPYQTLKCLLCGHEELTSTVHRKAQIEEQPKNNQEWQERFAAVSSLIKEVKGTLRMLLLTEAVAVRYRHEIETRVQMTNEALNGLEQIRHDFSTLVQVMGGSMQEALDGLAQLQNEIGSRLVTQIQTQDQAEEHKQPSLPEGNTDEVDMAGDGDEETQLIPVVSAPTNNDEAPKEMPIEDEDEEAVHVTIYTRAVSA